MSETTSRRLTRRSFFRLAGGAAAAAAGACLAGGSGLLRTSAPVVRADTVRNPSVALRLAATDGWMYLPGAVPIPGASADFTPDPLAPDGLTTYQFGFRNVTGMTAAQVAAQKGKAQASAPILWFDENTDITITLTNLGLSMRPDLVDSHTIHWHGFRNAIPLFDGVPEMSISVPIGRDFTYFYRPRDPGTYMYHCHFEDVEHVQMGMTGAVFVRPQLNQQNPGRRFAYNDLATEYDREFVVFLTDVWAEARYDDAHIQTIDWTKYQPNFWLMNGRAYPDTLEPNGAWAGVPNLTGQTGADASGNLIATAGLERLQYQPISSLIRAAEGDRVLLRFVSLGYQQYSMTLDGPKLTVVGKDARLLVGDGGTQNSYATSVVQIGPGESADAILVAPPFDPATAVGAGPGAYNRYLLYNRQYAHLNNAGDSGPGGQMTELRVYAAGTLAAQTVPNT